MNQEILEKLARLEEDQQKLESAQSELDKRIKTSNKYRRELSKLNKENRFLKVLVALLLMLVGFMYLNPIPASPEVPTVSENTIDYNEMNSGENGVLLNGTEGSSVTQNNTYQ